MIKTNLSMKIVVVSIALITFLSFSCCLLVQSKTANTNSDYKTNFKEYLLYGDYISINSSVVIRADSLINWQFIGSNPNVDLLVYAMTFEEFQKFEVSPVLGEKEVLSSGEYMYSGTFTVPKKALWVIVFYNIDDNLLAINLTYNFEVIAEGLNPWVIIGPILGGVITILGLCSFFYIRYKKKKQLPIIPLSKKDKEATHLPDELSFEQEESASYSWFLKDEK